MRLITKADRLAARASYIPKGARRVRVKGADAEFYVYEADRRDPRSGDTARTLYALCFIGTAGKPAWHYRFRTGAERDRRIASQAETLIKRDAWKAERKASAAKPHRLAVGTILVGSWGYEQTNVDFFEVVKLVGKTMVEVEEIGASTATDHTGDGFSSMSSHVVPDPEHRTGKVTRHRVQHGDGISSPKHGGAYVWDGKPKYCSWYG